MGTVVKTLYSATIDEVGTFQLLDSVNECTDMQLHYASEPMENINPTYTSTYVSPTVEDVTASSGSASSLIGSYWIVNRAGAYFEVSLTNVDVSRFRGLRWNVPNIDYVSGPNITIELVYPDGSTKQVHIVSQRRGIVISFGTNIDFTNAIAVRATANGGSERYMCVSYLKMHMVNPVFTSNTETSAVSISNDTIVVTSLMEPIVRVTGRVPGKATYRTYKRDANGIPQLVLADITSVSSGLGKTTLNDDLQSLVTISKVDDLIDKIDSCTFAGKVTSEDKLPTTEVKVGTVYLVGAEDAIEHEEFIYTEQGTWERLGSVRSSDVDLSGYTTTDGMNSAILTATSTLSTNLDNMDISVSEKLTDMTTSVDAAITATDTKVDASLGALTVEVELVDIAPTAWPDKMDDNGVIILVD